jgi:hypothetical protein
MQDLTTNVIKILDLLYEAKELLADLDESSLDCLYADINHVYYALKLEMQDREDLTKEQKQLIYN